MTFISCVFSCVYLNWIVSFTVIFIYFRTFRKPPDDACKATKPHLSNTDSGLSQSFACHLSVTTAFNSVLILCPIATQWQILVIPVYASQVVKIIMLKPWASHRLQMMNILYTNKYFLTELKLRQFYPNVHYK